MNLEMDSPCNMTSGREGHAQKTLSLTGNKTKTQIGPILWVLTVSPAESSILALIVRCAGVTGSSHELGVSSIFFSRRTSRSTSDLAASRQKSAISNQRPGRERGLSVFHIFFNTFPYFPGMLTSEPLPNAVSRTKYYTPTLFVIRFLFFLKPLQGVFQCCLGYGC